MCHKENPFFLLDFISILNLACLWFIFLNMKLQNVIHPTKLPAHILIQYDIFCFSKRRIFQSNILCDIKKRNKITHERV